MNLNRSVARYIDCTLSTLRAARAAAYASLSAALSIIAPGKCAESGISRDLTRPGRDDLVKTALSSQSVHQ